jgi:serine/threonine protein kinase
VRGLVHRDVTPRNALLSWEGEVKLADFGVAQVLEGTEEARTVGAHACAGTAGYMSPKQASREELDGRSDLYAVGIVALGAPRARTASRRVVERRRSDDPRPSGARASTGRSFRPISKPSPCGSSPTTAKRATGRPSSRRTTSCAARRPLATDGAALARLLDERFPRAHRQGPLARVPELGLPSTGPLTVTGPWAPKDAPP